MTMKNLTKFPVSFFDSLLSSKVTCPIFLANLPSFITYVGYSMGQKFNKEDVKDVSQAIIEELLLNKFSFKDGQINQKIYYSKMVVRNRIHKWNKRMIRQIKNTLPIDTIPPDSIAKVNQENLYDIALYTQVLKKRGYLLR